MVSTANQSGISLTFDLDPSSASAPSEMAVSTPPMAARVGTPHQPHGRSGLIERRIGRNDRRDQFDRSEHRQRQLFPDRQQCRRAILAKWNHGGFQQHYRRQQQSEFRRRIVNAATGSAEFEVGGTAYPAAGAGNWRFDNVSINATGGTQTPPSISTNPANQTVAAGQPVTFASAASGSPTPTVQWYEGGTPTTGVQATADVGGGTLLTGDTSPNLTFTTSGTAADNGNTYWAEYHNSSGYVDTTAASLNDALAAPVVSSLPRQLASRVAIP